MKNITQASPEDAAAILELQKLAYQSEAQLYNDLNIPPLTQTLDELRSDFTTKVFLKAQIEGKIVGSVRAYQAGITCYIERLITHPDRQKQGIGTTLMEQIESCFDEVQRFELFTGHKSDRNPEIRCGDGFFFGDCRTDGCGTRLGFYWRIWCYPDFPQRVSRLGNCIIADWSNPDSKTVRTPNLDALSKLIVLKLWHLNLTISLS